MIRRIRRGKKKWKEAVEYGKRWFIESFFSAFKRWFGEYVVSKRDNKHADDEWGGVGDGHSEVDEDKGILRLGRS